MLTIFKKSKIKIVVAIMSILMCLFLGTLAVIYISSYIEVSTNNYDMLERHAEMYMLSDHMDNNIPGDFPPNMFEPVPNNPMNDPGGKRFENTPVFQLSTFYSVAVSNDGSVLAIDAADGEISTRMEARNQLR